MLVYCVDEMDEMLDVSRGASLGIVEGVGSTRVVYLVVMTVCVCGLF